MQWKTISAGLLTALCVSVSVLAQVTAKHGSVSGPLYQVNFKPGDPVPGIGAMPAVRLPLECTDDGTMFISMVQAQGTGARPSNFSPYSPMLLLTSISRSGEAHSFPLDQVPDLNDLQQISDYASDSKVIFLVRAARGSKPTEASLNPTDRDNLTKATVERNFYIVLFDRQGNYEKTMKLEDAFRVNLIGLFPSGTFLAYGFDATDHNPKLALLKKDDGTILRFLEIPKGDSPESALHPKDASGKGAAVYVSPVQFSGQGGLIYLVQNKTSFPLLEVNEAGAIRVIKPKLHDGVQIEMLVPSDENIYVRSKDTRHGAIYELSPQDGAILRRFRIGNDESGADVACVHNGKFVSFEHSEGRLIPLIGTAEPMTDNFSADEKN